MQYYDSSRGTVAYHKRGWGDPLVMVHGIYPGASHDEFRHNISALQNDYTIYAIDLLGFGESDKPRSTYTVELYQHLLRDFIVEEIGEPAHVLASGVSCGFAVALAVYNDMLVRKLGLIDPDVVPPPPDGSPNLTAKVQQFLLGTLSMGTGLYEAVSSEFELTRFLRSRYAMVKNATEQRVQDLRQRAAQRHALYGFISHMTGHLSADVARWLRYVRCEVLVLWGEQVGPPPVEKLLRPAAWSRGKRVEVIAKSAHWPHDEQSARVNKLLLEFFEDAPAPAPAKKKERSS